MNVIPYSKWIKTKLPTRVAIARQFGIAKNRSTSVVQDVVVDDGYNIHEVENALNLEALQVYLESKESDISVLFDELVDKMEGKVKEVIEPAPEAVAPEVPVEPKKKKASPKKKK